MYVFTQQQLSDELNQLAKELATRGGNIPPDERQRKQQEMQRLKHKHLAIYVARWVDKSRFNFCILSLFYVF